MSLAPDSLLDRLWAERATAIPRSDDQQVAASAMDAAVRGGFSIVELSGRAVRA